jgi:hypothetical protein
MFVDGQNLNFAISPGAIDFAMKQWASASAVAKATPEGRSAGTELSEHTQAAIEQFVVEYIKAGESTDVSQRNQYFAPFVSRFYEHANYSRSQIRSSDQRYYRKWPVRSYLPIKGTFTVREVGDLTYVFLDGDERTSKVERQKQSIPSSVRSEASTLSILS